MLEEVLKKFGTIVSTKIPVNSDGSGATKGFAFVQFSTPEAASAAIQHAKENKIFIGGKPLIVSKYVPYEQRKEEKITNYTNIYVKNLPSSVTTEEDLQRLFQQFGHITSVKLVKVTLQLPRCLPGCYGPHWMMADIGATSQATHITGSLLREVLRICKFCHFRSCARRTSNASWSSVRAWRKWCSYLRRSCTTSSREGGKARRLDDCKWILHVYGRNGRPIWLCVGYDPCLPPCKLSACI
jgi:RNA recognition motif-containing protein